jgi:hypothetical protein
MTSANQEMPTRDVKFVVHFKLQIMSGRSKLECLPLINLLSLKNSNPERTNALAYSARASVTKKRIYIKSENQEMPTRDVSFVVHLKLQIMSGQSKLECLPLINLLSLKILSQNRPTL